MNVIKINKKIKIPLYAQIKDSILNSINTGLLKDNDPLPYEEEVSEFYHVARQVVRQAYFELEKDGYIDRIRRKGTFVNIRPRIVATRPEMLNLKYLVESKGYNYQRTLLLVESIFVNNERFPENMKEHTNHLIRICFTILANNYPIILGELFVSGQNKNYEEFFKDMNFDLDDWFNLNNIKVRDVIFKINPHIASNLDLLSLNVNQETILTDHSLHFIDEESRCVAIEKLTVNGFVFYQETKNIR